MAARNRNRRPKGYAVKPQRRLPRSTRTRGGPPICPYQSWSLHMQHSWKRAQGFDGWGRVPPQMPGALIFGFDGADHDDTAAITLLSPSGKVVASARFTMPYVGADRMSPLPDLDGWAKQAFLGARAQMTALGLIPCIEEFPDA
jgi:hypothetical protein